ncbi:MAG: DUF2314 domain-containing protein [Candidatus Lokiarchaeota archaeon]|nr:DUF2314 domain-containing protein [Candidatus Lokiarchaeota archaeon]MBD3198512.1 DUF2314 domain-containing protein [Candidatus Lokiarchaeota archaeon]
MNNLENREISWSGLFDPEMEHASQKARETFKFFWRELFWEYMRIVPSLDIALVKLPLSDDKISQDENKNPLVEHMWINNINFDGENIEGNLINEPYLMQSVKQGDFINATFSEISDWMYSINNQVYGAFTVNLLRSRMNKNERKRHDNAWGLMFADAHQNRITPYFEHNKPINAIIEHPMSEQMIPSLKQFLEEHPSQIEHKDERGWTMLHNHSLAGSTPTVRVLLEYGANPKIKTKQGNTPLDLAILMNWKKVITLFENT